ncbi:MetQ/NlpA family ABC transporter substrate-binding protein [Enterococcus sp. UD-01]|jgi:D-methionine transport system substrate-binding protein|uniref:MetQ/NlpA family ABC transporter substrate-binding protein n=1 Tax=Enterococcus sp. UD-01 TaxID=3373911 RepID=UPI0038397B8C
MRKKVVISMLAVAALMFAGCSGKKEAETEKKTDKVIKVASHIPSTVEVVELAGKNIEPGYKVELVQVNDNIQYNELLLNKEIDANFAQHEPFMQKFNEEKNGNLVVVQKIYNAKVGFYSKNYQEIKDLPEGAKIALPSDVSNEGRALAILADAGLIQLKDGVGFNGTIKDVVGNPKKLEWVSVDLLNLAEAYNEKDIAMVYNYPTYIAKIGLTPKDAILLEKKVDDRFAISLVAREDNKDSDKIKALKKAMTSDKVRELLETKYSETLVPAF